MSDLQSLWQDGSRDDQKIRLTPEQRDASITALVQAYFDKAANREYKPLDPTTQRELDLLFSTTVLGYREILLVIVVACLIDDTFKASEEFYKCNPRPFFEGPIRTALLSREIPHRQSGPLNVAKGTQKINEQWATRRRPPHIAMATVRLVQKVENMSHEDLENFAINLHALFLKAQEVSARLKVDANPKADPDYLYKLSKALIDNAPDVGNTPQRIVGYLLQSYHEILETGINVSGHEDRASTTNKTSKKLGDIVEERTIDDTKKVYTIYEVTVKDFGEKRVMEATESYSAVSSSDTLNNTPSNEIMVLCREKDKHSDVLVTTGTRSYLGKLEYQNLTFYYQDIYEWIVTQLLKMPPEARIEFYNKLHMYIQHPNTDEGVRTLWKQLHEEASEQ